MLSTVKEVKERTSSLKPTPPSLPSQSQAGFPTVQHRSQRISQFKRARGGASKVATGSSYANEPPRVRTEGSSSAITPEQDIGHGPGQNEEAFLRQTQAENDAKVSHMTASQRQSELEELEASISPELLAMLKARAEKKAGSSHVAATSNTAQQEPENETGSSAGKDDRSPVRLQHEVSDDAASTITLLEGTKIYTGSEAEPKDSVTPVSLTEAETSHPVDDDELSPAYIHQRYFANQASNPAELEWLQPQRSMATQPEDPLTTSTRFDLVGNPLTIKESEEMATHKGLHHHGDEAGRAGYTINEVIQLCASTFLPQRTMMLGVLGKTLARRERLEEDPFDDKLTKKAIDVIVGILCSSERNTGALREAISALHASMTSQLKAILIGYGWNDDYACQDPLFLQSSQSWVKRLPLQALLERISNLLDQPLRFSALSPTSIHQLIGILLIISFTSATTCDNITPLVPRLVRNFLTKLEWPRPAVTQGTSEGRVEMDISMMILRLLRSCTTASRSSATNLLNAGAYDVPLKFLYFSPWSQDHAVSSEGQSWAVSSVIVDTYEKLARYGLNGTLLSNTSDIWVSLGTWVSRQSFIDVSSEILQLVAKYFAILRVWLVSAKDPHSLEHQHDLIWTQISGYGWQDEADHFLHAIWPCIQDDDSRPEVWDAASSAMTVLSAWSDGCKINMEKNGLLERQTLAQGIQDLAPLARVTSIVEGGLQSESSAHRATFAAQTLKLIGSIDVPEASPDPTPNLARMALHIPISKELQSESVTPYHSKTMNVLAFQILSLLPGSDPDQFTRSALPIIEAARPGEEDLVMQLLDKLLDLAWPRNQIEKIGHRHGLYILRPFLHFAVLPDLEHLTTPDMPLSNMLRATTTLRSSPRSVDPRDGLPLRPDWLFVAVEQYLRRESSTLFTQLPSAWDASRKEMVRATLVFANLVEGWSPLHPGRSFALLNAMKVFLLEGARDSDSSEELFRDVVISQSLHDIVKPCLIPAERKLERRLDQIATSITPADTTFFQIYSDFVQLFDAMSLSDTTFSQLLVVPLSQAYPIDYRRLVWSEQPSVLRSVRLDKSQVPYESDSLEAYYDPPESDPDILFAYLQALAKGWVTQDSQSFLYSIAINHLRAAVKTGKTDTLHMRLMAGIERDLGSDAKQAIQDRL